MVSILDQNTDNFCIAPWVNLHVDTLENIKPCCKGAGISVPIGDLDSYLVDTHEPLKSLRAELIQNQQPKGCVGCVEKNWYSEFLHTDFDLDGQLDLMSLDLRWSNTCQLNCTYCNPENSSSWAAKFQKIIPIKNDRIHRGKKILFDLIDSNKEQISRVSLLGGEPLLIKENDVLLDLISGTTDIEIFSNLNCDLEKNSIFSKLVELPNVQWYISMENVGKKFEFVRRNASWERQANNIELLLKKSQSKRTISIHSQFCMYSATSVLELYQWVQDRDLKINWNWLTHPEPLDFEFFPDRLKTMSLQQIDEVKNIKSNYDYEYNLDWIIDKITESLGKGKEDHLHKCHLWHQEQEHRFFNDEMHFAELWPEYS